MELIRDGGFESVHPHNWYISHGTIETEGGYWGRGLCLRTKGSYAFQEPIGRAHAGAQLKLMFRARGEAGAYCRLRVVVEYNDRDDLVFLTGQISAATPYRSHPPFPIPIPMGEIRRLFLQNEEPLPAPWGPRPQAELWLDNISLDSGYRVFVYPPGYQYWPSANGEAKARMGDPGGCDPSDMMRAIDSRLVSLEYRLIEIADRLGDLGYREQPEQKKAESQKQEKAR